MVVDDFTVFLRSRFPSPTTGDPPDILFLLVWRVSANGDFIHQQLGVSNLHERPAQYVLASPCLAIHGIPDADSDAPDAVVGSRLGNGLALGGCQNVSQASGGGKFFAQRIEGNSLHPPLPLFVTKGSYFAAQAFAVGGLEFVLDQECPGTIVHEDGLEPHDCLFRTLDDNGGVPQFRINIFFIDKDVASADLECAGIKIGKLSVEILLAVKVNVAG